MMDKIFEKALLSVLSTGALLVPVAAMAKDHVVYDDVAVAAVKPGVDLRDRASREFAAEPSGTGDAEISRSIRQTLAKDNALSADAGNIKVMTIDGTVTLKGAVHSKAERLTAETHAKSVLGVTKVKDWLSVVR